MVSSVPRPGFDKIANEPPTLFTRSRMPINPSPGFPVPFKTIGTSNPMPLSLIVQRML